MATIVHPDEPQVETPARADAEHVERSVRRRFTVDEYHRLGEAGILGETERVELWDGEVVTFSPIGTRHQEIVDRANETLRAVVGTGANVRVQGPILLDDHTEPQPDLTVLRRRPTSTGVAIPVPPTSCW